MNIFKKFFILALSLTLSASLQTHAKTADGKIEALAMDDINSVLIETYNKGEGSAEVTAADCKIVKTSPDGLIAFCSLTVEVQPSMESDYKSEALCTSMGYKVSPDFKYAELFKGWDSCIENVNSVNEY